MTSRARIWVGSLLTIVGGGAFLSTPQPGAAAETFDCRESVRAYCAYAASFCASQRATCTYTTDGTCQITNIECEKSVETPP
jgi:hypothetical protein